MNIYAQPAAAAAITAFSLTNGGLFSLGKLVTSATVFSTAFGLEKEITDLSKSIRKAGVAFIEEHTSIITEENRKTIKECAQTVISVALNALAFYGVAYVASTALSFIAIPAAALTMKTACLSAISLAVFAKTMDFALSSKPEDMETPQRSRRLPSDHSYSHSTASAAAAMDTDPTAGKEDSL
jgi:hypothetical protein